MTDRTAMIPAYPSTDITIGGGGTVEIAALAGATHEVIVIDLYTDASGVRVAHGDSGIDGSAGYPLIAGSRNTLLVQAGEVLAFAGAASDLIILTVMR